MDYSDYFCHETLSESGNLEENVGDYCQRALLAARPEYECSLNTPFRNELLMSNSKLNIYERIMKYALIQNPLDKFQFFVQILNSFIISHLLELSKVHHLLFGYMVISVQCDWITEWVIFIPASDLQFFSPLQCLCSKTTKTCYYKKSTSYVKTCIKTANSIIYSANHRCSNN